MGSWTVHLPSPLIVCLVCLGAGPVSCSVYVQLPELCPFKAPRRAGDSKPWPREQPSRWVLGPS